MDKIQVIKCKCGKIFSACREPYCYTDKDYQKELRKYVEKGYDVEMVNQGEWDFEKCVCNKGDEKVKVDVDPNQIALFSEN